MMPRSKCIQHRAAQILNARKGSTINSHSDAKEESNFLSE